MRGLRSFLLLVAVLAGLGAYLYFVESQRTPDEGEKRDKVFAVEADAIDEVTITSEAGERTTLKKTGDAWQVLAPTTAPADAAEASGITTNLSNLEQQRLIEENPSDLEVFGLAKPRFQIAFKAGGQDHQLLVGSKTPTGSDLYAKTGAQPRVFLIASYLESTFNRASFDLRDKSALTFDRDKVDTLEVSAGGRSLAFGRTNNAWQITQPAVSRPDTAAIEGLLARLNSLQMKKLEAAEPGDLAAYGLDKPAATVRVGSGSSQATLLVGSPAGEGDVFAKDASKPAVFTVEAAFLEDLKKDAGEYRQKDLFDARAFNTTRIEITRAGQTMVFEKTKGSDGAETWRQTAPAAKDSDRAKVEALLSALTGARAESFAPAPGGATTEATVALTFDEGKQERVTLLKAGADGYATRDDASARIQAGGLDAILQAIDALR